MPTKRMTLILDFELTTDSPGAEEDFTHELISLAIPLPGQAEAHARGNTWWIETGAPMVGLEDSEPTKAGRQGKRRSGGRAPPTPRGHCHYVWCWRAAIGTAGKYLKKLGVRGLSS